MSFPPDGRRSDDGEEGQGEHGEGDVSVPGRPGADLVLVQPDLSFSGLKAGLDGPPGSRDAHQCADRGIFGGEGQVVGQLVRLGDGAADQQAPVTSRLKGGILPVGLDLQARPLGALAGAQPPPVIGPKARSGPDLDAVEAGGTRCLLVTART